MARNLVRFDPLAEFTSLQKQLFSDGLFGHSRTAALPTTDVYTENDKQLTVEVHLPHFSDEDVSVNVDQGALVIQAEKTEKETDKKKKYVVRESATSFYRRIMLPEQADEENVKASFHHGVLKVNVPFKELPSPRKIALTKGDKESE
ncbi:Hsp20/alpha crystallin family protein [Salinibacterium sp. dk2585]|uniref:Hsp20/alpha crystallin family protein n=1 Tax=unclassified Salinibacterium TaxID=2632331 RepID=UPI0011C256B4|nr:MULTISPECIES: Hsp20/alpha crystallin family protein [unclassified Salinibacterium]QEE61032.1 Hsp20/alpha crystallin family protein [Salinibacterium sp. dk2585]TXK52974.1 Hsp20/alpha crystallin family protein [Salinibacterium sp. dk5596]